MPKDFDCKRIQDKTPGRLLQADIWWLGFIVGISRNKSEEIDKKNTSKAMDSIREVIDQQKLHIIEALYFDKTGFDHEYHNTELPAAIIQFANRYAFAGMRLIFSHFNKTSNLGSAFLNALNENSESNAGLALS